MKNAFIVGAGTMGHGIAQVCAMAGLKTTLSDIAQQAVDIGLAKIKANLDKGVARGKVSDEDRTRALANLGGAVGLVGVEEADIFIEAIPEKMAMKTALFADVSARAKSTAILGSNTSSLSITEIAAATKDPSRVVGLHFFNPVHIMKLLEIVRGAHSSEATLQSVLAFCERLGKTPVVVNDAPGFATSRLGITLGNEAMRMVEEGVASPADVDRAMSLGYGHPMGPLALTDLVGLDVRLHISQALYEEIGTDTFRAPRILRRLVRAGALGKKCGQGFYIWENGKVAGVNTLAWR